MKRLAILLVLAALPASAQISIKGGGGSSGGSISTPVSIANGGTGNANGDGLLATCTDSVGTDAYACSSTSTPGCPASLAASEPVLFVAGTANTGAATFDYCALGAKALVKTVGGISTALATGDILAKQPVLVRYNATDDDWKMISAVSTAPAGSLAVGGAITSGTATRFLYEDGSNQLAESAAAVIASSGAVTLGTGLSGTAVPLTVNNGTSTGNILKLQDNGSDVMTVADGGGITSTGTNAWTGTSNTFSNSVFITGSGSFSLDTNVGSAGRFSYRTETTPDSPWLLTGATSNSYQIAETSDAAFDFNNGPCGTSACTDPAFIVHSRNQSTTQYISIQHNGTRGVVTAPGGVLFPQSPVYASTIPAVSNTSANSCGTTAATIAGTSETGIVTVGATAGTSCTMTFPVAAPTRRQCVVGNETTANLVQATYSSTTVSVFAGTFVAGDVLAYVCSVY